MPVAAAIRSPNRFRPESHPARHLEAQKSVRKELGVRPDRWNEFMDLTRFYDNHSHLGVRRRVAIHFLI